jgi:hypothetical protein
MAGNQSRLTVKPAPSRLNEPVIQHGFEDTEMLPDVTNAADKESVL